MRIIHGDCIAEMRELPDSSVDSIVTDPPYGLGFMGKAWDALPPGLEWAEECLRVLKPGGHLLAFGGTRTWHRLAVAVEDAGFEIRDSIAWLYGSGFPKSQNVSKAIDKAAGAERKVLSEGKAVKRMIPGADQDRTGSWIKDNGREFIPTVTEAATPEAQQWEGWGTALKPAFEPIVVGRKPLSSSGVNVLAAVESELRKRGAEDITWARSSAKGAVKSDRTVSLSTTPAQRTGETSVSPAVEPETHPGESPRGNASVTSTKLGETRTVSTSGNTPESEMRSSGPKFLQPMETSASAARNEHLSSSPSTTSTGEEPLTGKRRGERSISKSSVKAFPRAIESFAGIATGLTGSRAHALIEKLEDGTYLWPKGLPESVPGAPLTVAQNVLTHGTGALNIDASRIATDEDRSRPPRTANTIYGSGAGTNLTASTSNPTGRFPANVILDDTQAAALDAQSGDRSSPWVGNRKGHLVGAKGGKVFGGGAQNTEAKADYGDTGGASRFFYCAKAPKSERPVVDGVAHATVKPLALMRYLVKLVTPPGGTVLEPFAGSGTTVEACLLEGFDVIAIEREAEYLPLIRARVARTLL